MQCKPLRLKALALSKLEAEQVEQPRRNAFGLEAKLGTWKALRIGTST